MAASANKRKSEQKAVPRKPGPGTRARSIRGAGKGKGKGNAITAGEPEPADEGPQRSNPLGLEIDDEVLEFIAALDRFKKEHGRPFPSWSEVLHVLRALGYRRH